MSRYQRCPVAQPLLLFSISRHLGYVAGFKDLHFCLKCLRWPLGYHREAGPPELAGIYILTHKPETLGSSAQKLTVWLCAWSLISHSAVHKAALHCDFSRSRGPELQSTPESRQALHLASVPAWSLPEFSQGNSHCGDLN